MTTIPRGFKRWVMGVGERLRGGARDERGAVAVFFAVAIVVLAPLALGVVDIYMTSSQRSRLQDALDAAALYAARSGATDPDEIQAIGQRALLANLSDADEARLVETHFELSDSTVAASAEMSSRSLVSDLWNHGNMTVSTNVVRNSVNLEVAMVLDITGSMENDMDDLKEAANDLIDLIVQDTQTPYYSKLSIVPYSNAVNVGATYIDPARGAVVAGKPITAASKTYSNKTYSITFTSASHGFNVGDYVAFSGVGGMTGVNENAYEVVSKNTNTFKISYGSKNPGNYTSGGNAYCTDYGCQYYRRSSGWSASLYTASSVCVTERTGTYAYTDTSPDTAKVGFLYTKPADQCPEAAIMPLSTDKTALKALVSTLESDGATAGHIGIAWGWYTISPNFASMWPSGSRPDSYTADELLKVAVIMTDGEFNTAYCDGVSSSSFGSCTHANGNSTTQAAALCAAMKNAGVVVYTVGFRITSGSSAANLLSGCATDADHEYLPSSGQDLQDAFQAIGQDINSLRLSH